MNCNYPPNFECIEKEKGMLFTLEFLPRGYMDRSILELGNHIQT
jgi:hypothetical protein